MRFIAILVGVLVGCFPVIGASKGYQEYGDGLTETAEIRIGHLLSNPGDYVDKAVKVVGLVNDVCPMRGCWIKVKDNNSDIVIRAKVTDGVIVFPLSSKGKQVDIQGKFEKLSFTEQQAKNWKVHLAEEKGIILWLGGSGVDKDKYWSRGNSVNTTFDQTWDQMSQDPPIIFVYVTAPYDIRFSEFLNYPEDLEKWNRHVEKDILGKLPKLPVYIIGNSGGAALALNGLHKLPDIKGV